MAWGEAGMATVPAAPTAAPDLFQALSAAFAQYSEVMDLAPHDVDAARKRLQQLEEQWMAMGLCGSNSVTLLTTLRPQIAWECMVPDMFNKFYRFAFYLCKQPRRKHIQVDVALEAWRLLLTHRFRLLDKWCQYIASLQPDMTVVNEDQWRQVLEFSRAVHEDLSNYDPNGAWACFLDDFVDYLRAQRLASSKSLLAMDEDCGLMMELALSGQGEDAGGADTSTHPPMSPRCGSKRRSPDVDVVVERLSAIPLPSSAPDGPEAAGEAADAVGGCASTSGGGRAAPTPRSGAHGPMHAAGTPKRLCMDMVRHVPSAIASPQAAGRAALLSTMPAGQGTGPPAPLLLPTAATTSHAAATVSPTSQPFTLELPVLQVHGRRHIRPRRSNVSELVNQTVSGMLFVNE